MKKQFAVATSVLKMDEWRGTVSIDTSLTVLEAVSKDEAYGIKMRRLLAEFPASNGYSNHSVLVVEVENADLV